MKKELDAQNEVPVRLFIKFTRYVGDPRERAMLIAKTIKAANSLLPTKTLTAMFVI
jgi:hypothetical protein